MYRRIWFINNLTWLFYLSRSPLILYYFLKSKIVKERMYYLDVLRVANTLRIECRNYGEQDEKGNWDIKCKYKFNKQIVEIKVRFFKKMKEDLYTKFKNAIVCHSGFMGSNVVEGPYCYFNIHINMKPIHEGYVSDTELAIGTDYLGLHKWKYSEYPHMLICGDSGSGKSVTMRYLLSSLLLNQYEISLIDGKKVDWSSIKDIVTRYTANGTDKMPILEELTRFRDDMQTRYDEMERRGIKNYTEDLNSYKPRFLVFDEFLVVMETMTKKEREECERIVLEIALLGRASGDFMIFTMQRADAKYISTAIRDNFKCKMVLASASKESYQMMFNRTDLKGLKKGKAWLEDSGEIQMLSIPFYKDIEI